MNEKAKRIVLALAIGLSLIPPLLLISWPSTVTVSTVSLWVADTLGYMGIVLLLWMYILGAKSVMGLVFADLAPVLHIHKLLGKYGTIAILLHPLLVTLSYGESLLYSFIPLLGTEFERHVTLGRIAFVVLIAIWGVSWFLRKKMAFRPWKYLHYLAYISIPFALLHVPDVGSNYMHHSVVKTYFFVLVVTFIVFVMLRLRGLLNLDKSLYGVVSNTRLNDTDYVVRLTPLGESHVAPRRGQYVYLKLGYVSEDHPFSALQYDPSNGSLVIGYRLFGAYTNIMSKLQPGTTVYVGGPHGSFMAEINESERPVVFLAGGIGITPFVDQILANAGKREQWLFAANRSRETAVLVSEVAGELGNHLVNVYNTPSPTPGPQEETGYITADMLKKYLGQDLSRYDFYLCGPPPMMKSLRALMETTGVPTKQVRAEKFGW